MYGHSRRAGYRVAVSLARAGVFIGHEFHATSAALVEGFLGPFSDLF